MIVDNNLFSSVHRYSDNSTYLNRDSLSDLGLPALSTGADDCESLGCTRLLTDNGYDTSSSNTLFLLIYLLGLISPAEAENLLGMGNSLLGAYISRLSRRGLISKVPSPYPAYMSDAFYVPDYSSPLALSFREKGILPYNKATEPGFKMNPRMVPHTYGISLSTMMIQLFCQLRDGYDVKRVLFEESMSKKAEYRNTYVKKFVADITVDAIIDVTLPCGMPRNINLEFDTGTESIPFLAHKFTDYLNTPCYTEWPNGIRDYCTIVFSYNNMHIKADGFKRLLPFASYFRVYARLCMVAAYKSHMLYGPDEKNVRLKDIDFNISDFLNSYNVSELNRLYVKICVFATPGTVSFWGEKCLSEISPQVHDFIMQNSPELLSCAIDSSVPIKRDEIKAFFELSDFCDAWGYFAYDRFTLNDAAEVIHSFLMDKERGLTVSDDGLFKCPEPGMLARKIYNRQQYKESFERSVKLASRVIRMAEDQTDIRELYGNSKKIIEDTKNWAATFPLVKGYQVFFAPTQLLNNYLPSIIGKNLYGLTTDPDILSVLKYIRNATDGKIMTYSSEVSLGRNLSKGILRDVVKGSDGTFYSVSDASIETTALIRATTFLKYYRDYWADEEKHFNIVLIVRSMYEARIIFKKLFGGTCDFYGDGSSFVLFAIHPSLSFGFGKHDNRIFKFDNDGSVYDFPLQC